MPVNSADEIPDTSFCHESEGRDRSLHCFTIRAAFITDLQLPLQPKRFLQDRKKRHCLFASRPTTDVNMNTLARAFGAPPESSWQTRQQLQQRAVSSLLEPQIGQQ